MELEIVPLIEDNERGGVREDRRWYVEDHRLDPLG